MEKSMGSDNMAEISPVPHHSNSSSSANSDKNSEREKAMVAGTFLGVDFGKSKVGLAIADEETKMAFALGVLKNDDGLLDKLARIIKEKNVKIIVVGLAWHEKDEQSWDEKRAFGKKLEKELGAAVMFQDEMFTTKMAQDNIKLRGGKNIASSDDQEAARIILQSWLDRSSRTATHPS